MKRTVSFCMAILMALSILLIFGSCRNENEADDDTMVTTAKNEVITIPYEDTIPELDCGNANFNMLVSTQMAFCFVSNTSSDAVSLATYARNNAVEDRFHVNLNYKTLDANSSGQKAFLTTIRNSAVAGENAYDIIVPQFWAVPLMFEGCYHNLYGSEYLHLEEDWWYSNINDSAAINGKLYGVAGAFNMDKITATVAMFMNKNLAAMYDIDIDNLYQSVFDGNWTYADLYQMTLLVSGDLDNNGIYDENDKYGFISTNHGVRAMLLGFDMPASQVDDDGDITLLYMTEDYYNKFDMVYSFFNEKQQNVYWTTDYDIPTSIFSAGNALFYACDVVHISGGAFRGLSFEYGVFPMPKYNSEQANYVSSSMRWDLTFVMSNADLDRAAIILENLNYETAQILIPEYWELAVPYKYNADSRNIDTLNIIRNSVYWDFCECWNESLGGLTFGLSNLILNNSPTASSWWENNELLAYRKLDELMAKLKYLV